MSNNETTKVTASEMLEMAKKTLLAKMGCNTFEPDVFLTNLSADKENPNYYLEVKYRVLWFRIANPDGRIETELLSVNDGLAIIKATVITSNGTVLACSHGTCLIGNNQDPYKSIETAETKATGRALNLAGYGTVYCGEELTAPICEAPVGITKQDDAKSSQIKFEQPLNNADKPFELQKCLTHYRKTMTEKEALEVKCPFKEKNGTKVSELLQNDVKSVEWVATKCNPKSEPGAIYKVACEIVYKRCMEANQKHSA